MKYRIIFATLFLVVVPAQGMKQRTLSSYKEVLGVNLKRLQTNLNTIKPQLFTGLCHLEQLQTKLKDAPHDTALAGEGMSYLMQLDISNYPAETLCTIWEAIDVLIPTFIDGCLLNCMSKDSESVLLNKETIAMLRAARMVMPELVKRVRAENL